MRELLKSLWLVAMLCIGTATAVAAPFQLRGKVVNAKDNTPLAYVTATMQPVGSESMPKGAVSDETGRFTITGLAEGTYTLTVSYVGYKSVEREITLKGDTNAGEIKLAEDAQALEAVEVVGQKSQMRFELDKKVFNVDQNIASTGGSASDILTNIPSVEVDNEGQVSLRGNQSVTVWINGKASGLSSENRGDILRQLPAESIEKVEVITNPSARYSPEGTAGIINIVLKRDRRAGYYGGLQLGADLNGGYNMSGNINYSGSKLEAYANVGYRHHAMRHGGFTDRTHLSDTGEELSQLFQSSNGRSTGGGFMGRAGLTWHATKSDQFSLSFFGLKGGFDQRTPMIYNAFAGGQHLYDRTRRQRGDSDMRMMNFELGYRHDFSEKSNLDFTLSHNIWKMDSDNIYDDVTRYDDASAENVMLFQHQVNNMDNRSWDAQLDYTVSWSELHRLEAGYKGTFRSDRNPSEMYDGTTAEDAVFDAAQYNRFLYDQNVHALYITYGGKWKNLSYQAGLRGEYTQIESDTYGWDAAAEAESAGQSFRKDYFRLFPSAYLSYALGKGNELQLNYSHRIQRPWGGQLNNFRNMADATNISFGNPDLDPEYTNSFELNYIKNWERQTLSASLYYRTTKDVMQRINYMTAENIMYQTYENVTHRRQSGLELVSRNAIGKFLNLTSTVNLYYNKLDGFEFMPEGAVSPVIDGGDERFSWNARIIANVMLPAGFSLQLTGSYNSREVIAQGTRNATYALDAGVRKSFLKNKLSVSISARDLLDSRRWAMRTLGAGFRQTSENWWGGRYFGATLTWNFGNMRSSRAAQMRQMQQMQQSEMQMGTMMGGGMGM